MILRCLVLTSLLSTFSVRAAVEVSVEPGNGLAWIRYHCTAGELVRAFALDVTVDKGRILEVSDFFVGESTATAQGYGIFPGSFRDHVVVRGKPPIGWAPGRYSPVAVRTDDPENTLPGLGASGVTLEFGGLWDPSDPAAVPAKRGTLCALRVSEGTTVRLNANQRRGGVVSADPNVFVVPVFNEAFVQPPEITGSYEFNGVLLITYAGGDLQFADSLDGPWRGTGNTNGVYAEFIASASRRFFRVNRP